ncbi:hypothetical protein ES702_01592 [subsurface metagenome]
MFVTATRRGGLDADARDEMVRGSDSVVVTYLFETFTLVVCPADLPHSVGVTVILLYNS